MPAKPLQLLALLLLFTAYGAANSTDESAALDRSGASVQDNNGVDSSPQRLQDGHMMGWIVEKAGVCARYRSGQFDLDGDGLNDSLIYLGGPRFCGSGGCRLYIHRVTPAGETLLGQTTVTRLPVGVLESQTNGMRDLTVSVGGGGMAPSVRILRFDGENYASNPTVEPISAKGIGELIISDGELRIPVRSNGPYSTECD